MADRALGEDRDIRGAGTDVDQADAKVALVLGQHGKTGSDLLRHQVIHAQAAARDALADVRRRAHGSGDQVHTRLEAHATHADRMADALLAVDHVILRFQVKPLLVRRDGHRARRLDDMLAVGLGHFLVADRHDAVRVQAADMAAGDSRVDRTDLAAGHQFGFLDGALDRLHRRFNVDDHATLEAVRGMRADAHDLDRLAGLMLADNGDDLRGANVEADNEVFFGLAVHWRSQELGLGSGDWSEARSGIGSSSSEFGIAAVTPP